MTRRRGGVKNPKKLIYWKGSGGTKVHMLNKIFCFKQRLLLFFIVTKITITIPLENLWPVEKPCLQQHEDFRKSIKFQNYKKIHTEVEICLHTKASVWSKTSLKIQAVWEWQRRILLLVKWGHFFICPWH